MRPFFKDDTFNFLTEVALGAAYQQAADVGEVLSTAERIRNGRSQSWVDEWTATADRLAAEGQTNAEAGRSESASRQFLRASTYYSLASSAADGTDDPALFGQLWESHRLAWDRFVDLTEIHIERIEIPYEGVTLPGYFFRSGPEVEPRRTLIFNNGSDGAVTGAWVQGVADALDRNLNTMTFDGPGQNAALVRQHLPFRPDWENVITPVVDYLSRDPMSTRKNSHWSASVRAVIGWPGPWRSSTASRRRSLTLVSSTSSRRCRGRFPTSFSRCWSPARRTSSTGTWAWP